jgi:hypothetical protein
MDEEEISQAWVTAYAIAFAMTTLGGEVRGGVRESPEQIDARAIALADKATATVVARAEVQPDGKRA